MSVCSTTDLSHKAQVCNKSGTLLPQICPMETILDLIGGKYKALILWHLSDQTLRFNQLSKKIPSATPKMLTQQLRNLEQNALITRKVYPVVPPKVEYSLTDFGISIIPILDAMCNMGKDYLKTQATKI